MSEMAVMLGAGAVEDICDYCLRGFRRLHGAGAVCPSCGLGNVRESAMELPARERAVMAATVARRRSVPRKPKDGLHGAPGSSHDRKEGR